MFEDIMFEVIMAILVTLALTELAFLFWLFGWLAIKAFRQRCDLGIHSYERYDREYGFPVKKCRRCDKLKI